LTQAAQANGRFPRAERLLEDSQDPNHLVLAATYGLLVSHDHGQSWFHVCEASFAQPGQQTDPVVSLTDGALLTSIFTSLTRSTDGGCDFQRKLGGTPAQAVPDFTIDSAGAVLAVLVTTSNGATTNQLQESLDGGQHFHALGPALPDTLRLVATVDVAPSDPQRIYVSGLGLAGAGVLLRSDDRGESFTALPLATDAKSDEVPFIAAVEPNNPDGLYIRTDVWKYDELAGGAAAADALLYSDDGGSHFSELLRQGGKLFGFALSPDGKEVLAGYGDPVEGGGRVIDQNALGIYRAPAGTSSFEKAYDGPVSCLTWSAAGVYACTSQGQTGSALGLATPESMSLANEAPFTPLLSLLEVKGPLACQACASGAQCGQLWQATCTAWGRSDCDAPSAGAAAGGATEPGCPAAGGVDAGGADTSGAGAPTHPETGGAPSAAGTGPGEAGRAASGGAPTANNPGTSQAVSDSGCGCRTKGSRPSSGLAAFVLLGLALLWRRRGAALLLSALALAGCGHGAANDTPPPTPSADDECSGDFDAFEPGMTKLAKPDDITVELSDAEPSPPVVRRDNIWWLKLSDADGNAVVGAEVVASPYMPKHQHGSAEVVVQEQGEGQYQLSPIELIMPGVWEIPLFITTADGKGSETLFRFCIAER
jgi:MYXO-CTERM domain-containing protein